MTDEQFDEICRNSLAFEPGGASASTWSRMRPAKWGWLPTIPEILACGCACGLALIVVGVRFDHNSAAPAEQNPVIQRAVGGSFAGLQASALRVPDTTSWSDVSIPNARSPGK